MRKGYGAWLALWVAVVLAGAGVWFQEPRLLYSAAIAVTVAIVVGLLSNGPGSGE